MRSHVAAFCLILKLALAASCAFHLSGFAPQNIAQAQGIPAQINANPRLSTTPVIYDADDPAIWIHPTDPSKSIVIGTDKGDSGGLYVWDLNGQQLQHIPLAVPNNVDVRYGMMVSGERIDLAVTNTEPTKELKVYKIDPLSSTLIDITTAGGLKTPELKNPYGLCLYRRPRDGAMFVFSTTNGGDRYNSSGCVKLKFDTPDRIKNQKGCIPFQEIQPLGSGRGERI